ncbi:MAG: hypothetical protein QM739_18840 [Propionivibrio sp.]
MKRHLTLSIADQGIVSAFNFALNLYLVRVAAPEDFGLFAIVNAASLFAAMVQNAIVNTPLSVHLPAAPGPGEKNLLLRTFTAVNLALAICVLLAGAAILAWRLGAGGLTVTACASFYLFAQFVREFHRAQLAVEGRLAALLAADLACAVLSAGALAVLHRLDWPPLAADPQWRIAPSVFLVVGVAGMLTAAPWIAASIKVPSWRRLPAEAAGVLRGQLHEIRWSLLGVVTTEIQNRGYLYIAAVVFGPATVALLQAGRILFGPLNLLSAAWARVARPQFAALLARGDAPGFRRTLTHAFWAFAAFNLLFLGALWLAWPLLSPLVFAGKYGADIAYLVAFWGAANLVSQTRACLGIGAQALRRFRALSMATIAGAAVSLALVGVACALGRPGWLVAPVIAGECVAMLFVLRLLRRSNVPRPAFAA